MHPRSHPQSVSSWHAFTADTRSYEKCGVVIVWVLDGAPLLCVARTSHSQLLWWRGPSGQLRPNVARCPQWELRSPIEVRRSWLSNAKSWSVPVRCCCIRLPMPLHIWGSDAGFEYCRYRFHYAVRSCCARQFIPLLNRLIPTPGRLSAPAEMKPFRHSSPVDENCAGYWLLHLVVSWPQSTPNLS